MTANEAREISKLGYAKALERDTAFVYDQAQQRIEEEAKDGEFSTWLYIASPVVRGACENAAKQLEAVGFNVTCDGFDKLFISWEETNHANDGHH